jgi:FKBP-type peptidyl-prolyl cis-trans isomerase SlyD
MEKMIMKIQDKAYVAIEYTLSLDSGEVVDRSDSDKPFGFVFGAGQVIPGLEKGIEGMEKGKSAQITVEAEDGYGQPRPDLFRDIPREHFPGDMDIEPNMIFEATGPQGVMRFRVESVNDDVVVADMNHPLAGERLHFDVKVAEVRGARAEEMEALRHEGGCSPENCACCETTCD